MSWPLRLLTLQEFSEEAAAQTYKSGGCTDKGFIGEKERGIKKKVLARLTEYRQPTGQKTRAQPIWKEHRPKKPGVSGTMVDIGLGPTNGFMSIATFRSDSPRRVQTDAYHCPRVLNYASYHITSFSRISAKRLHHY